MNNGKGKKRCYRFILWCNRKQCRWTCLHPAISDNFQGIKPYLVQNLPRFVDFGHLSIYPHVQPTLRSSDSIRWPHTPPSVISLGNHFGKGGGFRYLAIRCRYHGFCCTFYKPQQWLWILTIVYRDIANNGILSR